MKFQKTISRYAQNTRPSIPPHVKTHTPRLHGIKAVAFDVYGTLLHSPAGEISMHEAVQDSELEFPHLDMRIQSGILTTMVQRTILAQHREKKAHGIAYPEVDIVDVWKCLLHHEALFSNARASYGLMRDGLMRECAEETALCYELQVNPVSPMPHAREIVYTLHEAGMNLGIVSNAQFYTAPVLEQLLGHTDTREDKPTILSLFSNCVWSYMLGEGKPSARLYQELLRAWPAYKAQEILFVGNDLRNDIAPPAALGMKTALFAGDAQSYRPRKEMKELADVEADACITDLMSVADILGII